MFTDEDYRKYLLPPGGLPPGAEGPAMPPAPPPIMPMPPAPPPDAIASPASGTGPMAPDWARSMLTQASPPPPPAPMALPKPAPLTPQTVDRDRLAAQNAQLAAINQGTESKSKIAQQQGAGELAAEEQFKRQSEINAKIDTEARAKTDADFAAYQEHRKELANTKINPDDRTTMQRIQGAIAIGLGGFAAAAANRGAGGGTNMALQIIEAKIAKSVAAQQANLQNKKEAVAAEGADIREGRSQNRDDSLDRLAKAQAMRDTTIREIHAQVAMLGSETAKAEGAQLIAGIQAQGARDEQTTLAQRQALNMQGAQLAEQKKQNEFSRSMQVSELTRNLNKDITAAPGIAAETQLHQAEAYKALHPVVKPGKEAGVNPIWMAPDKNGDPFQAASARPEDVAKLNTETLPPLVGTIQKMDENIRLAKEYSRVTDPFKVSEIAQKMQANQAFIASVAHSLYGRVNEKELDMVLQSAGDPAALISREPAMKTFRENLRASGEQTLNGFGYKGHWEPPEAEKPLTTAPGHNAPPLPPDQEQMRLNQMQRYFRGEITDPAEVMRILNGR